MGINFNEISKDTRKKSGPKGRGKEDSLQKAVRTGERTRFAAKPNPMVERDYQIFEYDYKKGEYKHIGDYVLVNKDEPRKITDTKVSNMMSILNKKGDTIDISNLTKSRVLFTIVPEAQASDQTKIIYKDYDGFGVSKDNAIFTIRKGVLYDKGHV